MRNLLLILLLTAITPAAARANIFTNTFGGSPTSPAQVAYASYSFGSNLTLFWPQFANGQSNVTATFMNMSATASGLDAYMPDATLSSVGYATIIYNTGSNAINVVDFSGGAIATIAPAATYYIVESGNTTQGGTWQAFQFGAGTSSASAAALAGSGLLASAGLLNVNFPGNIVNTNFSITSSSRAVPYIWTGGSGMGSLPTAASVGSGFFFMLNNQGGGTVTLVPSGSDTIDGGASSVFSQTQSAFVVSTGSAWYTVGKGTQNTFAVTLLNLNVSGSSDITETSSQAQNIIQQYTGALTGNINVIVPATVQLYYASNQTTGAYSLTLKTAAGTGIPVPQGQNLILYCDGTNVVNAYTAAVSGSLSLLSGSASSPSLSFQESPSTGIYAPTTGITGFSNNGARSGQIEGGGSDVNYWRLLGATTGNPVELEAAGSDTNVGLELVPQGTGIVSVAGALGVAVSAAPPPDGIYLSGTNALSFSTSGVNALTIGADQGAIMGAPSGGDEGAHTLNVAGNLYVNGSAVLTSVSPPTITLTGDVTGSSASPVATTVAKIQGTAVSGTTGSGNVAFSISPAFTTPNVGVASGKSLNMTATGAAVQNGIYSLSANTVDLATNSTNALAITSTQSVGIGTTAPDQPLTVAGTIHSTATGFMFPDSSVQATSGIVAIHVQTFCASGCTTTCTPTCTYTPSAGMVDDVVQIVGAGGGGSGYSTTGGGTSGAGGGSGAYTEGMFPASSIGSSQSITIGTGGSGGTASTSPNGSDGSGSSFGSLLSVGGGSGAALFIGQGSIGGAGGSVITSEYVGTPGNSGSSGGGASSFILVGSGGSSMLGSGGGPGISTAGGNGTNGGGGGGGSNQSGDQNGGNGGNGYAIVTEFCDK